MADALSIATQGVFVLLAGITLAAYARRRGRARLEIALVFASLAFVVVVAWLGDAGVRSSALDALAIVLLLAHPILLLRLVEHFEAVPRALRVASIVAYVAACGLYLALPTPTPAGPSLALALYFVIVEGYAAAAFVKGAFSRGGVMRVRLRLAALGTLLLASVFALIGLGLALPRAVALANALTPVLSIAAAVAYFLSFAPPAPLRRAWQHAELHAFLRDAHSVSPEERATHMTRSLASAAKRVSGGIAAVVLLAESDALVSRSAAGSRVHFPGPLPVGEGVVGRAFREGSPVVATASELSATERAAVERAKAELVYAVPIATPARAQGVLLVLLRRGTLYPEDDLALLALVAEQVAVAIEHAGLLANERALSERLARANEDLTRSNADLERFAYVASHDLQEPLRNVAVFAQRLGARYRGRLDAEADEQIGFIVGGVRQLQALIASILEYSRVGREPEPVARVDLAEVFDRVRNDLDASIKEAGATVERGALPTVEGDARELALVLQNLLGNAIKFRGEAPPSVHVTAARDGDAWTLRVKDNGIGLDEKYADRIFVPFQRLHTREAYPGTGIGLAIAKKIVERHGGRIRVESEPGRGATFLVTLPAR